MDVRAESGMAHFRVMKGVVMITKRFFLICGVVVLVGAAFAASGPKTLKGNFSTMAGLKGVGISIEKIDLKAALSGLTEKKIRETVEGVLRTAGIPILSESHMQKNPDSPYIFVTVNTYNDSRAVLYAFHVQVEFRQNVRLERNSEGPFMATTWESGDIVGLLGEDQISTATDAIGKCATEFTIAYLKGNEKR
jgi:hypothetical protein